MAIPSPAVVVCTSEVRPDDHTPVVLTRPTREGIEVPLFGADVWNLRCIEFVENRSPPALNFVGMSPRHKQIAKELLWQRLNVPLPSLRRRHTKLWRGDNCDRSLGSLKRILRFFDDLGLESLHEVEHSHLDLFVAEVMADSSSKGRKAKILKIADNLHESRDYLTEGGLDFVPWPGMATTKLVGDQALSENATPRIPEPVLGGLLSWALAYVSHFSTDIIAAEQFHRGVGSPSTAFEDAEAGDAFQHYLETEVASQGGVPGVPRGGKLTPAATLIALRAGVGPSWLLTTAGRAALDAAIERYPLLEACMPRPTFLLSGSSAPWRPRMSVADMKAECRHLMVACYIVCIYLSGMRDSEVQSLDRTCLENICDPDGRSYRFRLHGITIKGQPKPKRVSWVVIKPVEQAITILLALTRGFFEEKKDPHLFVRLHNDRGRNALVKSRMNLFLRGFARHCSEELTPLLPKGRARVDAYNLTHIPNGPDGPWIFATSQFRRTIAWHIANRPFGVIAGMIQYKHASIHMFEGYAGHSRSGFRAEIAQEAASARREDVVALFKDSLEGVFPAGPMAKELKATFQIIVNEIGPFPGQVVDNKRAEALVRQKANQLYPGLLADCFYVPSQALCQKAIALADRNEPLNPNCNPDCPSACWTHKHLPNWLRLQAETKRFSKLNSIGVEQAKIFKNLLVDIERRVSAIQEATNGQVGN